jgi:hypothetical protein
VGLIARDAESAGISTVCMSSAIDITRSVNPPRAVFLDYPLGHTAGPPGRPDLQVAILEEALRGLTDFREPGMVRELPFVWPDNPDWKSGSDMLKDQRTERAEVPQFQSEEDRIRFEKHDLSALAGCGCPECSAGVA